MHSGGDAGPGNFFSAISVSEMRDSAYAYPGPYPENDWPAESWIERLCVAAAGPIMRVLESDSSADHSRFLADVGNAESGLLRHDDKQLADTIDQLRYRLRREGIRNNRLVAEAFALVRVFSARILGMRHYDVQLLGGLTLLRGRVAEMETGEGKTLTAVLPSCVAAYAGWPVHVITANDYLAERDAELMSPLYSALGLSVGTVIQGMTPEQRRKAYECDVTYCSNKEVAFDYLKDMIKTGQVRSRLRLLVEKLYASSPRLDGLLLRGLCFGIVDEADSVMIDEAITPLIISGENTLTDSNQVYVAALHEAEGLQEGIDFRVEKLHRAVELIEQGRKKLVAGHEKRMGMSSRDWEEVVRLALCALHLYRKDHDYIVSEGKVQIVDEFTGRVMPDRSWEHGLHQLIETKEQVPVTGQRSTLARISYQRFFRRYHILSGMTGTASEEQKEFWQTYRLTIARMPTNRPVKRKYLGITVCENSSSKWDKVVERILSINSVHRPVLIGTGSVEASEELSQRLTDHAITHQLLNARQDRTEAQIISEAGQRGRITVATNMAGRGTDIKLGPGVEDLEGLHVIITEPHESRRIDRQLAGRSGRQGEPGSYEKIFSLEDPVLTKYGGSVSRRLCQLLMRYNDQLSQRVLKIIISIIQWKSERHSTQLRRAAMLVDEQQKTSLAFSGSGE